MVSSDSNLARDRYHRYRISVRIIGVFCSRVMSNRRPSLLLALGESNINEQRPRAFSVPSAANVSDARPALQAVRKKQQLSPIKYGHVSMTANTLAPIRRMNEDEKEEEDNGDGCVSDYSDGRVRSKVVIAGSEIRLGEKERKLATSYRLQIWKLVFRCLGRTSLHGWPYIALSLRSAVKMTYWIALIMIAVTLMIYALTAITVQFAERRTFLSSSHHFPKQLPFPAVTLCNLNSFRKSSFPANFSTDEVILFLNYISAEPWLSDRFDVDAFVRKYDRVYGGNRSFLGNFGHRLENMLLTCYFENRPCDISDFVTKITSLGICYTFNSGDNQPLLYTDKYGYENGLQVTLNAEEYEYFTAEDDSTGFYVFVHSPGYVPYIGTYRGFTVSTGQRTQVSISKTDFNLLTPPYGECNDHVELKLFDGYDRESCLIECETNSALVFCGCKAEYMPGDGIVCSLNDTIQCLNTHSEQFEPQLCDCPVPCKSVLYDTKFSYSKYPSTNYFQIINTTAFLNSTISPLPGFIITRTSINGTDVAFLNANASAEFFDANYLSFYIYYDTLEYTEIEEVIEYDLFQYIADFTGYIGFFTGAGFLTFFEMIELIYGAVYPSIE